MPKGIFKRTEEHKINLSKAQKGLIKFPGGRIFTKEHREKIIKSNRGKPHYKSRGIKHHNWKGGITEENHRIRASLEYTIWRRAVFERDKFTCIWCGFKSRGVKPSDIHADHIKPFAYFPELRFAIDNGRTLCVSCHKKTDTWCKNYV